MTVSPEAREVWKALHRLAEHHPEVRTLANALASNLLVMTDRPDGAPFRMIVAIQIAALERALRPRA
jgi:hypothetical protein